MPIDPAALKKIAADYTAAWCSKEPNAVASFYAKDGQIAINSGDALIGRAAIAEMAAGFHAEFPDLEILCDEVRTAGDHAIYVWTLKGHHAETKNFVHVGGWEEWDMNDDLMVKSSRGWFDAADYDRQVAGA